MQSWLWCKIVPENVWIRLVWAGLKQNSCEHTLHRIYLGCKHIHRGKIDDIIAGSSIIDRWFDTLREFEIQIGNHYLVKDRDLLVCPVSLTTSEGVTATVRNVLEKAHTYSDERNSRFPLCNKRKKVAVVVIFYYFEIPTAVYEDSTNWSCCENDHRTCKTVKHRRRDIRSVTKAFLWKSDTRSLWSCRAVWLIITDGAVIVRNCSCRPSNRS